MASTEPFFIVGVHRSGTTLLRYMFSSSSRIYIPPESDFIPTFFQKCPHAELSALQVDKILKRIFDKYRFAYEWQGKQPTVVDLLPGESRFTPASVLNGLYAQYARQNDAVRWADKTPIYTNYMLLIHSMFPQAKFIHIIRDGRDVSVSMMEKWGGKEFHVDTYFTARNWVRRISAARRSGQSLPSDKYIEVFYEDLVTEPESSMRRMCKFLDEPFDPLMLEQHYLAQKRVKAGAFHDRVRQPTTPNRLARWKNDMQVSDRRLFQHVAGPMLKELGYCLSKDHTLQLTEQLSLCFYKCKYETLQFGRRIAQFGGLVPPN